MYVKKANGAVEQYKRELSVPELVHDAPDTDALLQNAQVLAVRMLAGMQRATRSAEYVPDLKDTKMLKEIVEVTLTIEAYKQKSAQHDALAQLTEDELMAKVQRLASRKLT